VTKTVGAVLATVASFLRSKAMAWMPSSGSLVIMKTPMGAVDLGEALWVVVFAWVAVYRCSGDGGSVPGMEAFSSSKKVMGLDYL
jgi:hypothetical protein